MNSKDEYDEYDLSLDWLEQLDPGDELNEFNGLPRIRNAPDAKAPKRGKRREAQHEPKKRLSEVAREVADKDDALSFSYQAKKHEEQWIRNSLTGFYRMGWFDDILRVVKGGKEASVYQCLGNEISGEEYIAAKIYRPRMFRNLRNDHMYRVGRKMLDSDGLEIRKERETRAIMKRTDFGESLIQGSWIEHEYQTMLTLFEAGAPIPKPHARGNGAILMSYIGGERMPAPPLISVSLDPGEALVLFTECIQIIELMLSLDLVHGDFSAYNILYWDGKLSVIDFPQVVHPENNPNAWFIFQRDVRRICQYFAGQGVESDPRGLAEGMWLRYGHEPVDPLLPEDDLEEREEDNDFGDEMEE